MQMGYGLMVYSVNCDKIVEICGSGDDKLRRSISGRFKDDIASTNENLGYSNERGEPSVFLAIRHLIMGEEKNLPGVLYGYGLKYIVEYFGKYLDNNLFYPCNIEYLDEIDSQLAQTGASIKISDLIFQKLPIAFPIPSDFPLYGYWDAKTVGENVEYLQLCSEKTTEIQAIQQWLEFASIRGEGIVGYYH
jgi:hypothetical protein